LHRCVTALAAFVLFYGSFFAVLILDIGHQLLLLSGDVN
jgi:hypothetical protein